jgi:hypothetical protein
MITIDNEQWCFLYSADIHAVLVAHVESIFGLTVEGNDDGSILY